MDLMKLQNGTDVRGVAAPGVEGQSVNFTPAIAKKIAGAFVVWLAEKKGLPAENLKISVGHDSRITADELKAGILDGITSRGAMAYDAHLSSTPAMYMSTVYEEYGFDGAIMITASHLPFNRNGMKFFDKSGGLEKSDITKLLTIAGQYKEEEISACNKSTDTSSIPETDILKGYSFHLREKIKEAVNAADHEKPLAGLKIVVDAGNGAGGFFANDVIKPLGADITGSLYLEPDGMFPNHIPNPEDKTAMASIRKAVLDSHADLGIIFDTDVDRMSAVLHDGTPVNRDAIIAMMAAILADEYPGSTIVTDSVTSDRLQEFLEGHLGLKQLRFKRGYKNVINECRRLNDEGIVSPLAIETSGHGALKENYYLDDGAYMAVRLIISAAKAKAAGRDVASYIKELKPAYEEEELRIRIKDDDFASCGTKALQAFMERAERKGLYIVPDSYEGIRISFKGDEASKGIEGWLLLRMSLHDPLLPLNMEGGKEGDIKRMKELVAELLEDMDGLDLGILREKA